MSISPPLSSCRPCHHFSLPTHKLKSALTVARVHKEKHLSDVPFTYISFKVCSNHHANRVGTLSTTPHLLTFSFKIMILFQTLLTATTLFTYSTSNITPAFFLFLSTPRYSRIHLHCSWPLLVSHSISTLFPFPITVPTLRVLLSPTHSCLSCLFLSRCLLVLTCPLRRTWTLGG